MKLRLDEYYYIISDEIEDYMPQYMVEELVEIEGGFTFINPDGYYHFGGPDQMDGYVIRELEGWLKEYKEISDGDSHLMLNWLNELDVVFYEIKGEIKCFVLKEFD